MQLSIYLLNFIFFAGIVCKCEMLFQRLVLFLCSALIITSCDSHKSAIENKKSVFRFNESGVITSLDPAFARSNENSRAVSQLFNGLVQLDERLVVSPCIAKSWAISSDGLVYTFNLRNDIYFHDHILFLNSKGRKVRASDFVNSFLRILDTEIASPGAWVFRNVDRSSKSNYKGFVDENDSTLKIFLTKAFPPFLSMLAMPYCSVIPIELAAYYGADFRNHPIGTGPFMFKYWKEGERLVLEKNSNYFESEKGYRLPYLDVISISFLKDKQTAFLEFLNGNFDFYAGLDARFKDDVLNKDGTLKLKYLEKIKMRKEPFLMTHFLGFQMDDKNKKKAANPLQNIFVRKAISYAINKERLVTYLKNNSAIPAYSGIVPVGLPSFDSSVVHGNSYFPDKAKLLLKLAGFTANNPCAPIQLYASMGNADICDFIQNELQNVGITSNVELVSPLILNEMVAQRDVNYYFKNWQADYADAENFLALFYSKNFSPSGANYFHYSNTEFDKLYEKSLLEIDNERRYDYYRKMDQMLVNDVPLVPLYYDASLLFTANSIFGLTTNAMNQLNLKKVKKIERLN